MRSLAQRPYVFNANFPEEPIWLVQGHGRLIVDGIVVDYGL
jgi:hypothetical protein